MGDIILTISVKCNEICERKGIENCTECLTSSIPRRFDIVTYFESTPVKVTTIEAQKALEKKLIEIMNELDEDEISEEVIKELNKSKKSKDKKK